MTSTIASPVTAGAHDDVQPSSMSAVPVVALKRRTIDSILIGFGVVATAVLAVAGGLLTWGSNFSNDYVHKELSSQHITFPDAAALTEEGRTDLVQWGGKVLDTGEGAQAYASYINGHLEGIADGATYADLGTPQRAAAAAAKAAVDAKQPQAEIDALQAKAAALSGQRTSLFTGETLRGLLLSAYAWSTVGTIAGYAAFGAFAAAVLMAVLVVLGLIHHRKVVKQATTV